MCLHAYTCFQIRTTGWNVCGWLRCSCRIAVLLLFLKASLIENRLKFAPGANPWSPSEPDRGQTSSWVSPSHPGPSSTAQFSRALLEAEPRWYKPPPRKLQLWLQGQAAMLTLTHGQEVHLKSNPYCCTMFFFHTERPYLICIKLLSLN